MFKDKINQLPYDKLRLIIILSFVLMLIIQVLILSFLPVTVYHDPLRVLDQASRMANNLPGWHITYFFRYAQNVQITFFVYIWLRFCAIFGLTVNTAIHLLSLLVLDTLIYLLIDTSWKVSKKPMTTLATMAFLIYTPFAYTYYLQVFYTDLPGMLALAYIFRTLLFWKNKSKVHKISSGILLLLASLLGTLIKANMVVILPSILIFWLVQYLLIKQISLTRPLIVVILGVLLAFPVSKLVQNSVNFQPQYKYQFPITSWMAMGLNSTSNGVYSGSDVIRNIEQPSLNARDSNNKEVIIKRISKLGPIGLIRLWLAKLGILTNVSDIQSWYNGGYKQAPGWFLKYYQFYSGLISVLYQSATCALFILVIKRLLEWSLSLTNVNNEVLFLIILTELGYLAFHVFLWEVNGRYGQVFVPMFLILLSIEPSKKSKEINWKAILASFVVSVPVIAAASLISGVRLLNTTSNSVIVAAQRAQLSTQYGAKPTMILSKGLISQKVTIEGQANYFTVQARVNSVLKVYLYNLVTKEKYYCYKKDVNYIYEKTIQPGTYEIRISNQSVTPQPIDIIYIPNYHMATTYIDNQGKKEVDRSLIYYFRKTD
ncbi:hypothetical protein [Lactobacillus mulieris]|uniref:Glycosyltransferase RgtA/B/C/D-like domain-containing protein n=1 Tax=Lactobacillus mulieris TaxID=2508708 RepID=A0AAW5X089_9LACO|nr:hypothetical protein [Lactobacillus mulieris]MCZ3622903.1 hypothetical protein [Lactobacillus mulieris]MCZ3636907.1 hypothetical protein [Lactobacillus mulieris]MCZ3690804.1 hypothetical protein [Lactobacillus mulieris]MCZ3696762.1 hypothetical protein [Lactobacillus mulieris]MCZ3702774.1 hypothetical protein [Lactobacillus mulieris]